MYVGYNALTAVKKTAAKEQFASKLPLCTVQDAGVSVGKKVVACCPEITVFQKIFLVEVKVFFNIDWNVHIPTLTFLIMCSRFR